MSDADSSMMTPEDLVLNYIAHMHRMGRYKRRYGTSRPLQVSITLPFPAY